MGRTRSRGFFTSTKSWIVALILGVGLFGVLIFLLIYTRPPATPVGAVTAAITVIPSMHDTVTPTELEIIPTNLQEEAPTLEPGVIGVGAFVQVSGTGGDGLRLRKGPGLGFEMKFLGLDGELFLVADGPVDDDGYTWWFVVGSYDETRQGWAVVDFLTEVPKP